MVFIKFEHIRHGLPNLHFYLPKVDGTPQYAVPALISTFVIIPPEPTKYPLGRLLILTSNYIHPKQFYPLVGPQFPSQQVHFNSNGPPQ